MADIRVLHGHPTHDEIAALVIALTPVATQHVADHHEPAMPAWTRAALHEGTGGATVHAPDGLVAPNR